MNILFLSKLKVGGKLFFGGDREVQGEISTFMELEMIQSLLCY